MKIKPASKNQFRNWKKLLMGKYRRKEKLFIAEGIRCVEQIINHGTVFIEELIVQEGLDSDIPKRVSAGVYSVPERTFAELSDTGTPQGLIAVCREPGETTPEEIAS